MNDIFDLKGRVAIVTGGSRGIGKMIATEFVKRGVRVYITARKAAPCLATAEELSQFGECIALPHNLAKNEDLDAFVDEVKNREDKLDILINNAGAAWTAEYDDFPESGWDKVMDLNLKALFFLTQKLTPLLRKSGSPSQPAKVINIASIDGIHNARHEAYSYAASKAGLIHLTRRMAKRLISENININAIAPGAFASDMNLWARDNPDETAERIPAKRIGKPSDIAGTAVYMCSSAGDYIVGITIAVDGGIAYAS